MAIELEEENDERGRVFDWAREKGLWLYVSAFFIVSIIIHGSGFYLFQVVYPSPVRAEADPEQINILDASDPLVRTILQRVSDRTIYLKPASAATEVRIRLKDNPVRFTPAFQGTSMPLEALRYHWTLPGVISPIESTGAGSADHGNSLSGKLTVRLSDALNNRGIAPWSIMKDYFEMAEAFPSLHFEVEVSSEGNVAILSIESELEDTEEEELRALVESTLRFNPGGEAEKGSIEIFVEG